jgi:signal transduction histidine kinase
VYSEVVDGRAVTAAFDIRVTRLGDGFLQNFRDVTGRYRAQQDLAASEKQFRSAVDALMDPFFIFGPVRDDQGKIVDLEYRYANQAALRLYQMRWQDVVGHGQLELFPSVAELGVWDTYVEAIETGTPARIDLPFFDEHGVAGSFELSATPGGGGLIVAARDITEARRAQEALRASEERFRTSVEAMQDGFAVLSAVRDSAGAVADFRYEYINDAGCRMDQRSREETVGHTLAELFFGSVTSGLLASYARVVETGEPLARDDVGYEDVYGGRQVARAFDIRAVKLGDGIGLTWRDVAERRRADETMASQAAQLRLNAAELEDRVQQRTADLLRSNQELESFSYSVAHDLRAPLRAINGYCQILLNDHAAQLDEDGQTLLGNVGRYAVRMGHLIEGLLALAHIGRKDPEPSRIDMTALAESVAADLRTGHTGAGPGIAVGQLADASGDPELIRQVWENLIGNAVKFSANREDPHVTVEYQAAAGEVIYHVRDNGVGFDMAYAGKLFGAFQRLHDAADFPGTGIGLAIVARIVQRHGGRVWADGRVGDGACFSFTLPAVATEKGETP